MPAHSVFICDRRGKTLISRNYRGKIPLSITQEFRRILAETEEADRCPIIIDNDITFVYVQHNDLYILSVSNSNSNAMLVLSYLYKIIEVFEDYFGTLEQESIRDNFVLIYELFDEMCDFGYPQHTDPKMLKDCICVQDRHRIELAESKEMADQITATMTGKAPWRKEGIKHKKNEVFLDVVEKLNLLVAPNGNVLHSEILGALKMKSYLSGMPDLKLGLNDKIMMERRRRRRRTHKSRTKSVEMDDIRFHPCVRLQRFETERVISFIPPDGEFELMSYRLDTQVRPLIRIEAHRDLKPARVEFMIKAKSEFKRRSTANNVEILVPVPTDAACPKFKTSIGSAEYVPEENAIKWSIKQFKGQKEYLMRAHFALPSVRAQDAGQEDTEERAPVRIKFEIPYFTVSGIQVRYLKIVEKSGYQALPWVRYITQNGDYQIRM